MEVAANRYGDHIVVDAVAQMNASVQSRLNSAFKNRSQMREKLLAGFSRRDASRGAVEQPKAELLFE